MNKLRKWAIAFAISGLIEFPLLWLLVHVVRSRDQHWWAQAIIFYHSLSSGAVYVIDLWSAPPSGPSIFGSHPGLFWLCMLGLQSLLVTPVVYLATELIGARSKHRGST
jgi:hypothetical protein